MAWVGVSWPDQRIVGTDHSFAEAIKLLGDSVTVSRTRLRNGQALSEHPHLARGHGDRSRHAVRALDVPWSGAVDPGAARGVRTCTRAATRCGSRSIRRRPAGASWARCRRAPSPQAVHRIGRRQERDLKSLNDAIIYGPIYVGDVERDLAEVEAIINRSYAGCLRPEVRATQADPARSVLSLERSLGSVIKLLTPNPEPLHGRAQCLPGDDSESCARRGLCASSDFIERNGGATGRSTSASTSSTELPGHELKLDGRQLVGCYLRVGLWKNGAWRTYKLRQDFIAADKVQMEDDITASTVVPISELPGLPSEYDGHASLKIAENCEYRLFQRPDEAVHPGFDQQTEKDMSDPGLFVSNFQPLTALEMRDLAEQVMLFDSFTEPMKQHMQKAARTGTYDICSAKPRLGGGKPSKNPRYLQVRPDMSIPRDRYLADLPSPLPPHSRGSAGGVSGD